MADNNEPIVPPISYASSQEISAYKVMRDMFRNTPIPDTEILANLCLYTTRVPLSRMLFLHKLYVKTLNTHGIIMEFGVRWGKNMALFTALRNIYEPHNFSRKIIGFDTFSGFPSVAPQDNTSDVGALSVTYGYENYLDEILSAHEQLEPRSNIKKHQLIKGDVIETLPVYLEKHPETIIALAYFDLDLYEPTKRCLELIKPYLVKNSVIGFDELVLEQFPGETQALKEAWGISNYEILRDPISHHQSYLVVG